MNLKETTTIAIIFVEKGKAREGHEIKGICTSVEIPMSGKAGHPMNICVNLKENSWLEKISSEEKRKGIKIHVFRMKKLHNIFLVPKSQTVLGT